ncbi:restriction endonuclease subunit S [Comamonas sp. Y33R10-2]|uniref:restriction endonuclease subunit S n=1 Tax=Comamonas sp. Y33R10-2 TaxID=2853257 RepID=UPI001C5CB831|nr:restriction endonuclease subunit S [Comamonas sp. Y33R10-2]QXZ10698.1 restriction endonuclease subunit S [Comamonas sp. Y33R10-2]
MSALPTGWSKTPIDAIAEFNPKTIADDSLQCAFSPMQHLGIRFRASMGYEDRKWGDIKKAYVHFQSRDVIVAKVTPCFENGKAGVVPEIPNGIGAGSSEFCVFRPAQGIDERYLLAWLSTEDFRRRATVVMTGSVGLKRVPKDVFLSEELPLAPESEQRRIADKLDTVLTRVDTLNDRLARIIPLLKRFRQSVLAAATSGRLTEDWRISHSSAKWSSAEIQNVAHVGTGSTPLRSNPDFFATSGTPWVTSSATSEEFVKQAEEHVTSAAIAAHRLKIYPVGTLLVAMYGEGKTRGQVTELKISAAINQACAAVIVDETKISKQFVKLSLQANYLEMRTLAEGGNQPNLNLSKIKSFAISVPSQEEQTEIVRRVEILFAYADRLEARLQTARTAADRLTPALLAKAFCGELVPQDPNDEPATELLCHLREARADKSRGEGRRR